MFRSAARNLLLLGAVAFTGCGTLGNLADHDKMYGGALMDADCVITAYKDVMHRPDKPEYSYPEDVTLLLCGSLDFPFSALGDTATLPITFTTTVVRHKKELSQQEEADRLAPEEPAANAAPAQEPIQGPPRPEKDEADTPPQTETPDPDKKDAQGRPE